MLSRLRLLLRCVARQPVPARSPCRNLEPSLPKSASAMASTTCTSCHDCCSAGLSTAAVDTARLEDAATARASITPGSGVPSCALPPTGRVSGTEQSLEPGTSTASATSAGMTGKEQSDAAPKVPLTGKTFYKRVLPSPPAIAFSSPEGKRLFGEALSNGGMEGFFPLIEQFRTQDEPAFCGLASLAMVLNALSIDPRRAWKGPWRWFHEALLDCCAPLPKVAQDGITLSQAACLARCNGAATEVVAAGEADVDAFRQHVVATTSAVDRHIVVTYSRKQFLQTGDGHFSPIGGYHAERDMVLILDTARFKYPPHWVPLLELHRAMFERIDPVTGKARGYMLLGVQQLAHSVLFSLDRRNRGWRDVQRYLEEGLPHLVTQHGRDFGSGAALLAAAVSGAPIRHAPAFIAARTDGDGGGGPCVNPQAVEALLTELAAVPLTQVVSGAAPAQGTALPLLAARLSFLLLLVPASVWKAVPDPQARREIQELLNVDGASIVAAEAAYLRQQAVQIPVLEAETAALTACRHCASDGHAAAV